MFPHSSRYILLVVVGVAFVGFFAVACSKAEPTAGPAPAPTSALTPAAPTAAVPQPGAPTLPPGAPTSRPASPTATAPSAGAATPVQPTAVAPSPLLLTIREPADGSIVQTSSVTIRGQTVPGALVSINGEFVEVDASGNFSLRVALEEGANVFDILASDEEENEATLELVVFFLRGR